MIDVAVLQLRLLTVTGWLDRQDRKAMAYLIEENRLLRRQIGVRRLRLTGDDRRRLAVRAYRLGRAASRDVATIVTPDTLPAMAPAAGGPPVDVSETGNQPSWRPG